MLRLGHIDYSNCVPVHARLLAHESTGVTLHAGVPSELNRALAEGRIDVAPCSSIEYARHADRYRILPSVVIGARGAVQSILLESSVDPAELSGKLVAVPTASATSVVLLRILLERRWGVTAEFAWYDQAASVLPAGAAAALRIGDVALRRSPAAGVRVHDLGREWHEWTGLPFAFALWQTNVASTRDDELRRLHHDLVSSLEWFEANASRTAERYAAHFGFDAPRLQEYWRRLQFRLDDAMVRGLERFYALAAEIGELPSVPALRWAPV